MHQLLILLKFFAIVCVKRYNLTNFLHSLQIGPQNANRLSAFDVILDEPIPHKGEILTQISNFWFNKLADIMPNHFTGDSVFDVLPKEEAEAIQYRAVVCKRLTPVKIESIVRGYLTGSGFAV